MTIDEIEDKIAKGEMSASQVFTQMKQHTSSRNSVIDECVAAIESCERVDISPQAKRLRYLEVLGAIGSIKS